MRFWRAIQEALARGLHVLWTHQGGLQTLFDKALTDGAHRIARTVESFGHVRIGPVGTVGIYLEEDRGLLDLRGCCLTALSPLSAFLLFVVCEAHTIPTATLALAFCLSSLSM